MIKLQSISYDKTSEEWYSPEFIPDNPRSVLVYTEDGGTSEAYFKSMTNQWIQYRWNCEVRPIAWREMPHYES